MSGREDRETAVSGRSGLRLAYSLADQNFGRTKSLGILNVSVELCRALAGHPGVEEICAVVNEELQRGLGPGGQRLSTRQDPAAAESRIGRIGYDQWRVYTHAEESGMPWLVLPKGYASVVRRCPVKLACYVHDAMPEHYREHHPGFSPRLESLYFRRAFAATVKASDVILTNSDFTRSEVLRWARARGWPDPTVRTVGIGMRQSTSTRNAAPGQGLVVLSSRFPHKRTALAVEYLQRWQTERGFAESVHWIGETPAGLEPPEFANWIWHARMEESAYRSLLADSRALVYFTEYEGFGMPPVESTIAGVAAVYSDIAACREAMVGLGFAFDNESYDSFARSLGDALAIKRTELDGWAESLLARHDWHAVATRVIDALSEESA